MKKEVKKMKELDLLELGKRAAVALRIEEAYKTNYGWFGLASILVSRVA